MADSVSSFESCFGIRSIALGEQPPQHKREVIARLAEQLHFERKPFDQFLDLREGKLREADIDASTYV